MLPSPPPLTSNRGVEDFSLSTIIADGSSPLTVSDCWFSWRRRLLLRSGFSPSNLVNSSPPLTSNRRQAAIQDFKRFLAPSVDIEAPVPLCLTSSRMNHNEFHVVDMEPLSKTHKPKFVWNNQTLLKFPYKGTHIRYHLPDFQRGQTAAMRAPRGSQETFNYRHSSLRNIIERTFGVWKARWALLRDMHVNFTYDHQVQIVIASMAVHNYIRRFGRDDGFNAAEQESYNPRRGGNSSEEHDERIRTQRTNDDDMYMAACKFTFSSNFIFFSVSAPQFPSPQTLNLSNMLFPSSYPSYDFELKLLNLKTLQACTISAVADYRWGNSRRLNFLCGVPLPLDLIHVFWRKLNLHPSVDSQVDDEAQMFTQNNPTIIREPVVQIINRGGPSSKKKTFRNSRATQPPNDSYRDGCSNTSESYINQFPYILHLYISNVHDVQADGNCGFRAIAACLGLHEDNWSRIRADLLEELDMHQTEYDDMFGSQLRFEIYNSLNFFRSDIQAPYRNWMTLPETGILVASRYNVILHSISNIVSTTYFPLWSTPPPMHEQVAIAIGFVNNNHYVRVLLREEYPMPPVYLQWNRYRRPQAAAWITPYIDRINLYAQFLNSNRNF
ncbi:hypothetical protein LXL04_025119 [Taraxacum kok-saghyz]